jgi:hypothetical protein
MRHRQQKHRCSAICLEADLQNFPTIADKPPGFRISKTHCPVAFCLAYARGNRHHGFGDEWDYQHDRAVVVTPETQPKYDSGEAAWTSDEGHTWFSLPNVSGGGTPDESS